ncbi:MAG: NIPSNAP family protein [Acidobacteria bacterium]|nr:NIPSNAP family protein [Acidobacteriota bacterium]
MKRAILAAAIIGFACTGTAQAQQPGPPPCGPQGQLPAEFSKNVAPNARCFEIRMYTANTERGGDINTLHQRFREEEVAIFEKHGAEVVAVWQRLDDPNTLVWMLAYRDLAHRQDVWAKFAADPAWEALRTKYEVPISAEVYWMSPTDYSHLK